MDTGTGRGAARPRHGDLDLRRLRVLVELEQRGTVSAVAAALHLTPSAVSQQLAALARELGVPLTEPVGRRLRLTGAARVVVRHAHELFEQAERLREAVSAYRQGESGDVGVAGFATTLAPLILPAAGILRRTRPGCAHSSPRSTRPSASTCWPTGGPTWSSPWRALPPPSGTPASTRCR